MSTNKGSTKSDNAPIFLRKTYELINTCDPNIATWADDGSSFVVKDVNKFASEEIPTFFKHNNFSSFVRQLNLYGFRKIRIDPIRIRDEDSGTESKYWRFRHANFLKGRPDLLSQIKKTSSIEPAEKQEVDALKIEVKDLKNQLSVITKDMDRLASLVGSMMKNQEEQQFQHQMNRYVHDSAKKRRIASVSKATQIDNESTIQPLAVTSLPDASTANDSDLYDDQNNTAPQPQSFTSKDTSIGSLVGSLSEYDEDLLATLLALDDDSHNLVDKNKMEVAEAVPDAAISSLPASKSMYAQPDHNLVEQLRQSLNNLPKRLQKLFVNRLVHVIASPEAYQSQVKAVSDLATIAAQEAKTRLNTIGKDDLENNNNAESVELATAALGSFLARYGVAFEKNELTNNGKEGDLEMEI